MRWHYIEKDEWPEETDTMVLCECHFGRFPEYHVAMYTEFEDIKDFAVKNLQDTNEYTSIGDHVYAWIKLDDITEAIHYSQMYEEAALRRENLEP